MRTHLDGNAVIRFVGSQVRWIDDGSICEDLSELPSYNLVLLSAFGPHLFPDGQL